MPVYIVVPVSVYVSISDLFPGNSICPCFSAAAQRNRLLNIPDPPRLLYSVCYPSFGTGCFSGDM